MKQEQNKPQKSINISFDHLRALMKPVMIFVVITIVLGVIANIIVDNPYAHRIIRVAINEKVEQYTNVKFDFKAINVRVLPMEVNLYGFNLFVDKEKGTESLASASQVHARVSLISLLLGTPKIGNLEITDLRANYPIQQKVLFYGDDSDKSSELVWPPQVELPISSLTLQNANISFSNVSKEDPESLSSLVLSAQGVDFESDVDSWDDVSAFLKVSSFKLAMGGRPIFDGASLKTDFIVDSQEIHLENLQFQDSLLTVDGFISTQIAMDKKKISKVETNGDMAFKGDLKLLDSLFDIPDTQGLAEGQAGLNFSVGVNPDEDPEFKLNLSGRVKEGEIFEFSLFDSRGELEIDANGIKFNKIEVLTQDKEYGSAVGFLSFNDAMDFNFEYAPNDLPLSQLLGALTVPFNAIDARLNAKKYRVSGRGFPFELKTDGLIQVDGINVKALHNESDLPQSPKCYVDLKLRSTAKALFFDGSEALCFTSEKWLGKELLVSETGRLQYDDQSSVKVSGGIDYFEPSSRRVKVDSEQIDLRLADYFTKLRQTGRTSLNAEIFRKKGEAIFESKLKAQVVQVEDVPIGDINAHFTYSDSRLKIIDFSSQLDAKNSIKIGAGEISFKDDWPYSLDLIASHVPEAILRPIGQKAFPEANVSLSCEFLTLKTQGDLKKPLQSKGRINGLFKKGVFDDTSLFDAIRFDLTLSEKQDALKYFSYQIGGLVLNATAKRNRKKEPSKGKRVTTPKKWRSAGVDFNDHIQLSVGTTNRLIDLDAKNPKNQNQSVNRNIRNVPFLGKLLEQQEIDGVVSLNLAMEGRISELSGTMQLGINELTYRKSELAPLNVEAFLQSNQIDSIIRHSGNALTGRLTVKHKEPGYPFSLYLKATRLDIRAMTPLPFHSDPRNFAYLTSSLNLDGTLENWWNSIGMLKVDDMKVNYTADFSGESRGFGLHLVQPVEIKVDQGGWNLLNGNAFALEGDFLKFKLETGKNNPPENIDLKFSGSLDIAGSELLTSRIESASGIILFNGSVGGSVDDIDLRTRVFNQKVRENNVTFGLVDVRPAFENIDFDMTIDNDVVILNRMTAKKGGGTISALGRVGLQTNNDSQIDVTFEGAKMIFPAPVVKLVEAEVSGNIFIKNALPPYDVSGNIQVDRGRTVGEIDPRKEIVEALRKQRFVGIANESEPLVKLNVNFLADNSLIINNRNMQATLSSNLRLSGSDIQPIVLGQVEINKGKFIYKRDFNLTQGLITFDDPVKLDPKLDINAIAEAQNYRVFIAVSGRASEPVVDLSTDPATRDDGSAITKLDIITLLSTGSLPDVNRNDVNSQTVAQTEALNIFAGQLEEPVERLFDLAGQNVVREVYIDTYAVSGGRPLARLNMPLNLGKNWDMIFRVDQESWKVSSEYSLHENISILGSFDGRGEVELNDAGQTSSGDTGVDVRFRFSFP